MPMWAYAALFTTVTGTLAWRADHAVNMAHHSWKKPVPLPSTHMPYQ